LGPYLIALWEVFHPLQRERGRRKRERERKNLENF